MAKIRILAVSLLLLMLLVSCAPQASPTPTSAQPPSAPAAVPVPAAPKTAAPAKQPWELEWEKLISLAQKEGSAVVYCSASATTRATLTKAFRDKYGVSLEFVSGRGSEIAEKVLSENRAGLHLGDVYIGGTTTQVNSLKPAGVLVPLEPVLILPEVKDPKVWWEGKLPWADDNQLLFASLAFPTNAVSINTKLVKKEEIESWNDLLNPKWKGKIGINDPTITGPGLRMIGALLDVLPGFGEGYLRKLAQQEPYIIRDQRLQVDWLAQGKISVLLAPDPAPIAEFQSAGASVDSLVPKEGTVVTTGIGAVSLLKAPHPNAAKLFINWFLSKEGQTLYSRAYNAQSGRLDVPTEGISPAFVRQPGVKYLNTEFEAYAKAAAKNAEILKEIFGSSARR